MVHAKWRHDYHIKSIAVQNVDQDLCDFLIIIIYHMKYPLFSNSMTTGIALSSHGKIIQTFRYVKSRRDDEPTILELKMKLPEHEIVSARAPLSYEIFVSCMWSWSHSTMTNVHDCLTFFVCMHHIVWSMIAHMNAYRLCIYLNCYIFTEHCLSLE